MSTLAMPGQIITANDIEDYQWVKYGTSITMPQNWLNAGVSFGNEPRQAGIFDDEDRITWFGSTTLLPVPNISVSRALGALEDWVKKD